MELFTKEEQEIITNIFPLQTPPLIHCLTNEITIESVANAILYVGAKPAMATEIREFPEFFAQNDAVLLNLGNLSGSREAELLTASRFARETSTPCVVDLVGVAATKLRQELAQKFDADHPTVIKGNISEMRKFVDMPTDGRGVDAAASDQGELALKELATRLQKRAQTTGVTYLATGPTDLIVDAEQVILLKNGVEQLDWFTGTGDIIGGIIASILGVETNPFLACITAVSYLNIAGELAAKNTTGEANFRQETLNNLSLLRNNKNWIKEIKGSKLS